MQKSVRVLRIKFAESTIANETHTSLGTKVRVCSCRLVIDCTKLISNPTTMAVPSIGIASSNAVCNKLLIISTANSKVIKSKV
jgi:hypothetical protein